MRDGIGGSSDGEERSVEASIQWNEANCGRGSILLRSPKRRRKLSSRDRGRATHELARPLWRTFHLALMKALYPFSQLQTGSNVRRDLSKSLPGCPPTHCQTCEALGRDGAITNSLLISSPPPEMATSAPHQGEVGVHAIRASTPCWHHHACTVLPLRPRQHCDRRTSHGRWPLLTRRLLAHRLADRSQPRNNRNRMSPSLTRSSHRARTPSQLVQSQPAPEPSWVRRDRCKNAIPECCPA